MAADRAIQLDVFLRHALCFIPGGSGALFGRKSGDVGADSVERPTQVDRGRARGEQLRMGRCECCIRRVGTQRERESVGAGDANQRRPAHHHRSDRMLGCCGRIDSARLEAMRQHALIDHADGSVVDRPDRAHRLAVNLHMPILRASKCAPERQRRCTSDGTTDLLVSRSQPRVRRATSTARSLRSWHSVQRAAAGLAARRSRAMSSPQSRQRP